MSVPLRFIAHAGAGRGAFSHRWPPVAAALAARGIAHAVDITSRAGEASELARRAAEDGARMIVAVGGDGTLHEVVNGLLEGRERLDDEPMVGVVPAGRGSDYARGLGLPRSPDEIVGRLAAALEGDPAAVHRVDAAEVTYRPVHWIAGRTVESPVSSSTRRYINAAGTGFSTVIALRVSRFPPRLGANLYTVAGIVTIIDWRDRFVELGWDDGTVDCLRVESVEAVLGPYEGGGMRVAPGADPSDGLLDVMIVGAIGRLETLTFAWRIRTGDHLRSRSVSLRRTAALTLRALDEGGPLYLQADGELLGRDPFSFRVLPSALRFVW